MDVGSNIGPYRIVRVLGQGGMGVVYEAVHEAISRRVALKLLNAEYASNPDAVLRLFNEARAVNLIEHPALVQIYDFGKRTDGTPYLVMELLSGQSLAERLHHQGAVSIGASLQISLQVAEALAIAHEKGIIHRDLKPWNFPLLNLPKFLRGEFRGKAAQLIPNYFGSVNQKSSTELLGVGSKSVTSIVIFHSPSIIGFHAESQDTCVVV